MIRLFVAIGLPEGVRDRLDALCAGLPGARWVEPRNRHLTVRFIGEVEEPRFPEIDSALSAIRSPAFSLAMNGVDCFGDRRRARVLWAGVRPCERLSALRSKTEAALARAGLEPETRKFHPHVTLARLDGAKTGRLAAYLETHGSFLTEEFPVGEFALYSSHLGRNGASHVREAAYPLTSA